MLSLSKHGTLPHDKLYKRRTDGGILPSRREGEERIEIGYNRVTKNLLNVPFQTDTPP
jgi:hypothetical protein